MLKKMLLPIVLILFGVNAFAHKNTNSASVSFQLTKTMTVTSTTALVELTVNATLSASSENTVQEDLLGQLNATFPGITWKTIDYQQTKAQSGANNIYFRLQARLSSEALHQLSPFIQHHKIPNQSIQSRIVNFKPSNTTLNDAKNKLMTAMYADIQTLTNTFNQKTQSTYRINAVTFQTDTDRPRQINSNVLLMGSAKSSDNTINTTQTAVAEDITMHATIVLTQQQQPPQKKSKRIAGPGSLPPAYLSVKHFQDCLGTKNMGTWTSWCKPQVKPNQCPQASWDALQKETMTTCDKK